MGASFWNGGAGPAADSDGNVYVVSANGDFDGNVDASRYDESVLRFAPGSQLSVADLFTPFNKRDSGCRRSGSRLQRCHTASGRGRKRCASPPSLHIRERRPHVYSRPAESGRSPNRERWRCRVFHAAAKSVHIWIGHLLQWRYLRRTAKLTRPRLSGSELGLGVFAVCAEQGQPQECSARRRASPPTSTRTASSGAISAADGGSLVAYNATNLSLLFNSSGKAADNLGGFTEFLVPTIADSKVFAAEGNNVSILWRAIARRARDPGRGECGQLPERTRSSPGSLFTIFGSALAPVTASTSSTPVPLSLADVSVTVNGTEAGRLLFVSAGQINAQMPYCDPTRPGQRGGPGFRCVVRSGRRLGLATARPPESSPTHNCRQPL